MFFDGTKHEKNYLFLLEFYKRFEPEERATLYIVSHPDIFKLLRPHSFSENILLAFARFNYSQQKYEFNRVGLTKQTAKMLEFASSLQYDAYEVNLCKLFDELYDENYIRVLIEAIKIRKHLNNKEYEIHSFYIDNK